MLADSDRLENNLEDILSKTVFFIEDSIEEAFAIAESSRDELANIKNELFMIQQEIDGYIDKLDSNEEQLQQRRREVEQRYKKMDKTNQKAESLVRRMGVVKAFLGGEILDANDQFDELRNKEKLAFKIIQAQEAERKRVAREIHDGPAQSITNLVLRTELFRQTLKEDKEQAINELDDFKDIVRSSVKDIRKIIYDLRPLSLGDIELVPTLRKYINDFITETGIIVELIIYGEVRALPSSYEVTIFRLVQEALTNMRKHSDASCGRVQVEFTKNDIKLVISDDGKGFNQNDDFKDSYGIITMKERCRLLQGDFKISSELDKGTRINIILPLDTERKG